MVHEKEVNFLERLAQAVAAALHEWPEEGSMPDPEEQSKRQPSWRAQAGTGGWSARRSKRLTRGRMRGRRLIVGS